MGGVPGEGRAESEGGARGEGARENGVGSRGEGAGSNLFRMCKVPRMM